MSSRAGSAFVPSSKVVTPFTLTRPSRIICSDARRDATPACDRIFCNLFIVKRAPRKHENTKKNSWVSGLFVSFRVFVLSWLHFASARKQVPPESRQLQYVAGVHGPVGFGVRDE